jgi:hypothetical protein
MCRVSAPMPAFAIAYAGRVGSPMKAAADDMFTRAFAQYCGETPSSYRRGVNKVAG